MRTSIDRLRVLRWLLLANVAASVLHYVDNVLFFAQYPEPYWIDTHMVDAFWFAMTPLAWLGYRLMQRKRTHAGAAVLYLYAAAGALVLGHYRYAPWCGIAVRIHAFILIEAAAALVLAAWVAWMQFGNRWTRSGLAPG
jgi:hypothetical protein